MGSPSWIGNGSLVWSSKVDEIEDAERPEDESFEAAWTRIFSRPLQDEVIVEEWNGGDGKNYRHHGDGRVSIVGDDGYQGIISYQTE